MSQDVSFRRKVIYIGIIALLLFPLFWLGQPAQRNKDRVLVSGGHLAKLREQAKLSQANLGDIDPAGESMKLATLGLRGVAANLLWEKANEYKMKEDWDKLSATLNQITKLQPNFISVWEFQAHNLSYNISVEFDDYRYRYHWVKKGIDFLIDGTRYNQDNPRLLHSLGWFTGQKFGRADEHVQFRELFRGDEEFHDRLNTEIIVDDGVGFDGRPDNWLVGRQWYLRAEQAVGKGNPLKGKSPLIFYADAPMSLINYASTIEDEGILGQTAQRAWYEADAGWRKFGERPIPTSWGHTVELGNYDAVNKEVSQLTRQLDELAPGVREQIYQERVAGLTDQQRAALDVPEEQLTPEQYEAYSEARQKTAITNDEIATRAPEATRDEAVRVAKKLSDQQALSQHIAHYRGVINYEYWSIRCAAEQTEVAVAARENLFKARQFEDAADLEQARAAYEAAWKGWRTIFDRYPRLTDDVSADDLVQAIKRYHRMLQQLDEPMPADFPLVDFVRFRRESDDQLQSVYQELEQRIRDSGGDAGEAVAPEAESVPAASPDAAEDPPLTTRQPIR